MLTGSSNGVSDSKPPEISEELLDDSSLTYRSRGHAVVQRDVINIKRKRTVNQIIWIVGLVVIVLVILGFLGLR